MDNFDVLLPIDRDRSGNMFPFRIFSDVISGYSFAVDANSFYSSLQRRDSRKHRRVQQACDIYDFTNMISLSYNDETYPGENVFDFHKSKHISKFLGTLRDHHRNKDYEPQKYIDRNIWSKNVLGKRHKDSYVVDTKKCAIYFSYVWCVEYGSLNGRPHFHLLTTIDKWIDYNYYRKIWKYGAVHVKWLTDQGRIDKYVTKLAEKYMNKSNIHRADCLRSFGCSQDIKGTPKSIWKCRDELLHATKEEVECVLKAINLDVSYPERCYDDREGVLL